jgi:integrase/recombinase XerD
MYMSRRLVGGISKDWASDIEYWLEGYLDFIEWKLDETKTYEYLELLREKYSLLSYRKRAYQIRLFLEHHGIDWAQNIKPPREPKKLPKRVTNEDIQSCLDYFKDHPYEKQMKAIILLGASSGMRPEEMYQLKESDIDYNRCMIRVNHDQDNGYSVKTGQSRITFFSTQAQMALTEYLSFFNNSCLCKFLFGQKHCQRLFNEAPIRIKDLRKFFSQELDRRGGPTSIKKMLMGHSGDVDSLHYNMQSVGDLKEIYNKVNLSENLYEAL